MDNNYKFVVNVILQYYIKQWCRTQRTKEHDYNKICKRHKFKDRNVDDFFFFTPKSLVPHPIGMTPPLKKVIDICVNRDACQNGRVCGRLWFDNFWHRKVILVNINSYNRLYTWAETIYYVELTIWSVLNIILFSEQTTKI